MYRKRLVILKQYKENDKLGKGTKLRTFQIQSIFADPNEPLSRIMLIGLSQLTLLGFYVCFVTRGGQILPRKDSTATTLQESSFN
jgi:hypothetical protein